MKNVVDGKIEIDCLIRNITNGFSSFFSFLVVVTMAIVAKLLMYIMGMCHRRQLGLIRANHKGVNQKNAGA